MFSISTPCSETIEQSGFCQHCQKTVHDLSKLTLSEALALYHRNNGQLCARLHHDASGQVQFQPEPPTIFAKAALIGISLAASATAAAQPSSQRCAVEIRATDAMGAAIVNATVTLIPKDSSAGWHPWAGVLNQAGIAQATLAKGNYVAQVHSPGFKTWSKEISCSDDQQATKVEAVLDVGEITMGMLIVEQPHGPIRRAFQRLFGGNRR